MFAGLLWFLLFAPSQLLKDLKASFFDFVFIFFFKFCLFAKKIFGQVGKDIKSNNKNKKGKKKALEEDCTRKTSQKSAQLIYPRHQYDDDERRL